MSRAGAGFAVPMGTKFDPDAALLSNASEAWAARKALERTQREYAAKLLARRVFKTDELAFEYRNLPDPTVPLFNIEGELIAWMAYERRFGLVELCSECGEDWTLRAFGDLAGLGRAIELRDADRTFVCQDCRMAGAIRNVRKRKAA